MTFISEFLLPLVIISIFATLLYGSWLVVEDKDREYKKRRKTNDK